jgi:hypothetical protein
MIRNRWNLALILMVKMSKKCMFENSTAVSEQELPDKVKKSLCGSFFYR